MPNATDPGGHLDISAWRQALLKEGLLLPGIYQGSHSPTPAPSALPDIRANAGSPSRRSLHSRLSGAADDKTGGSSGPRLSGEFLRRSFTQMQDSDSSQRATTAPSDGMRNLSHSMSSANGASSSGSPAPSPPHAASPIPGSSGTAGGSPSGSHHGGKGDNRTHGHNASHTCGVSLAWLGRLAKTLGDSAAVSIRLQIAVQCKLSPTAPAALFRITAEGAMPSQRPCFPSPTLTHPFGPVRRPTHSLSSIASSYRSRAATPPRAVGCGTSSRPSTWACPTTTLFMPGPTTLRRWSCSCLQSSRKVRLSRMHETRVRVALGPAWAWQPWGSIRHVVVLLCCWCLSNIFIQQPPPPCSLE